MTRRHTTLRFLTGFALLWSLLFGLGRTGSSGIDYGIVTAVALGLSALLVETKLLGAPLASAPRQLGLGRPGGRSLLAASVVAAIVVAPVAAYVAIADADVELRAGWPLLLVGLVAYHGIAEELIWRGYAYGQLRRTRPFRAAILATTPLIAATHVPVMLESGVAVGVVAIVIAAVTCLPLGYLYELGGRTIWAAAIVHAAIDAFKLLDDPASAPGLTAVVALAGLVCPFAIFAWRLPADRSARPRAETPALAAMGGGRS